jgi:hypothetical protein
MPELAQAPRRLVFFERTMDPTPLQTLIELRRREENDARAAWIAAHGQLAAAETEGARLDGRAVEAQARLADARRQQVSTVRGPAAAGSAASADLEARFLARLRDTAAEAVRSASAYRSGPLAGARARARTTAAIHDEKRRAREAAERHEAGLAAEREREGERRAEDARDDLARASRHTRARKS